MTWPWIGGGVAGRRVVRHGAAAGFGATAPLAFLWGGLTRDLGIDLGCANTLVYMRGTGIVIPEPSVVTIDTRTRRAFGVGVEAKAMVGKTPIEETPPELVADIMEQGITLAGGGALLLGLDRRLQTELKMPVYRADDPLTCVARGTGRVAEALHLYQRALAAGSERRRAG